MKQFKLLRDLPDMRSGEIFQQDLNKAGYVANNGTWYLNESVEGNPEWFSEVIPEDPESDKFVWTETMVLCFADLVHHNGYHKNGRTIMKEFAEFKKTKWDMRSMEKKAADMLKSLPPEQPAPGALAADKNTSDISIPRTASLAFELEMDRKNEILKDRLSGRPADTGNKDWEILSFVNKDNQLFEKRYSGGYYYKNWVGNENPLPLDFCLNSKELSINSVLRKNDNTTWEVNQDTKFGKIRGFELYGDGVKVLYPAVGDWQFLNSIGNPKGEMLFTTVAIKFEDIASPPTKLYVDGIEYAPKQKL